MITKLFLMLVLVGNSLAAADSAGIPPKDIGPLTTDELKFYFDSIVLKDGGPVITLSEHTSGASWSHFTKAANAGICRGKQVFQMAQSNRLDIIGKNFSIFLLKSERDVLTVWLFTIPNPDFPEKTEARRSSLKANSDGRFEIAEVPLQV